MKKSKHIAQTCLVIVKNLSPSGDYIELGICRNYTDSMIYELTNKVPELHIHCVDSYEQAMNHIENYNYAFVTVEGSFIEYYNLSFILDRMVEDDIALIGHVLNVNGYYELHDQSFCLDVNKWKSSSKPHIRKSVINQAYAVKRDPNNIHDDYTPRWIKPDLHFESPYKIPVDGSNLGSLLISELIGNNYNISAFNDLERAHKYYLYGGTKWFYSALFWNQNYSFCNEPLEQMMQEIPQHHEQYWGIASPYYILAMSYVNPKCKQWHVFDNSDTQLIYCKWVLDKLPQFNFDVRVTFKKFLEEYPWINSNEFESDITNPYLGEIIDYIQSIVKPYDLGEIIYIKQNIWVDQEVKIKDVPTLAYISNVFRYTPASQWYTLSKQKDSENKMINILRANNNIHTIITDMKTEIIQ